MQSFLCTFVSVNNRNNRYIWLVPSASLLNGHAAILVARFRKFPYPCCCASVYFI